MKSFIKFLLVLIGLIIIGSALFLLVINYNLLPGLNIAMPSWVEEYIVLAAVGVLVLIALIILSLGFRSAKKIGNAVLKGSEFGEVVISIPTVENMVLRVIQQTEGIRDVSRKVKYARDGLIVQAHIQVMADLPLSGLIKELQSKIKSYLEETTGIKVHTVKVLVENITTDQSSTKTLG